ncbi:MAG: hypothetical protein QOE66_3429 [Chloroflexota bacterium]|nr:hypothetical protein [Chloroflexota bacterium]
MAGAEVAAPGPVVKARGAATHPEEIPKPAGLGSLNSSATGLTKNRHAAARHPEPMKMPVVVARVALQLIEDARLRTQTPCFQSNGNAPSHPPDAPSGGGRGDFSPESSPGAAGVSSPPSAWSTARATGTSLATEPR